MFTAPYHTITYLHLIKVTLDTCLPVVYQVETKLTCFIKVPMYLMELPQLMTGLASNKLIAYLLVLNQARDTIFQQITELYPKSLTMILVQQVLQVTVIELNVWMIWYNCISLTKDFQFRRWKSFSKIYLISWLKTLNLLWPWLQRVSRQVRLMIVGKSLTTYPGLSWLGLESLNQIKSLQPSLQFGCLNSNQCFSLMISTKIY